MQDIVRDYNEKREDKLSVVLATAFQPVSPQFQVKYTFWPMMKWYGISLEYWWLYKSLLHNLITLNRKQEMSQQKNMLPYGGTSKGYFNLVPISRATSLGILNGREKIQNGLAMFCMHFAVDTTKMTQLYPFWSFFCILLCLGLTKSLGKNLLLLTKAVLSKKLTR